jgi:tRNA-2-methylthio-N6-dimethylallyladenosine synthase
MSDTVTPEEKTRRIVALQSLQREIQTGIHEAAVGADVEVLVDSVSRRDDGELSGRTMGNTVVNFRAPADTPAEPASWVGRTVRVRVTRGGPHSLRGEAVPSSVSASILR